jgi:hypothetical protein
MNQVGAPFSWWDHAYGSLNYTLAGTQMALAGIGLLMLVFAGAQAALGLLSARRRLDVQNTALFWYGAAVSWLLLCGVQVLALRLL